MPRSGHGAWISDAPKHQVPDAMTQTQPALLEFGQWPVLRSRGKGTRGVFQQGLVAKNFQHLLGVGFPVRGTVDVPARLDPAGQFVDQGRLYQPPLVMFGLVPGIGKKDMHTIQAAFREHELQDLDRIVLQDADIAQPKSTDLLEQCAHASLMDFAGKEVFVRHQAGNMGCGIPHAKSDFQNQRPVGKPWTKCLCQVDRRCLERKQKIWPPGGQGLGLATGGAACAFDKALDGFGKLNARRWQASSISQGWFLHWQCAGMVGAHC